MRSTSGIFYGVVITRPYLIEILGDDLQKLYETNRKKSTDSIDDFLDSTKGLKKVQDELFPENVTLILASDLYRGCDERVDDMILGIEIKAVQLQRKKSPTTIYLSSKKRKAFKEILLAFSIEETPRYILRAPDERFTKENTRSMCGIYYGVEITREELKELLGDKLKALYNSRKRKSMKNIDDFLDDAEEFEEVQNRLLPEGTTLILASDHYDCSDERYDDVILGIELKVINARKMKSPTAIRLSSRKRKEFEERVLKFFEPPEYILRAPV